MNPYIKKRKVILLAAIILALMVQMPLIYVFHHHGDHEHALGKCDICQYLNLQQSAMSAFIDAGRLLYGYVMCQSNKRTEELDLAYLLKERTPIYLKDVMIH